ncbi:MAG: hypothetical protein JWO83_783 [Caulobacteraceae bacterium]|nr:hypothetical protein [Caulobacteraceae bacterium]
MPKPLLLDTNLLLLFVVGETNPDYIAKHKRLQVFDKRDHQIVRGLIADSAGLVFCPNVTSETSNLLRYIHNPLKDFISDKFSDLLGRAEESYISSAEASRHQHYTKLGITDAVLLTLAKTGAVLFTDDLDLYLVATRDGLRAENYNHLREARPDYR